MADLSTKTLNQLDTITEMGESDKILVESNGRMKKFSGEIGGSGSGVYILNSHDFTIDSESGELTVLNTVIFNDLFEALDTGITVYLYEDVEDTTYYMITSFYIYYPNNGSPIITIITGYGIFNIKPSNGYSLSDLYTPTNIIISEDTE